MVVLPVGGIAAVLPRLVEVYRTGAGLPYAEYGDALRGGQAGLNRPVFDRQVPAWIARLLPDLHTILQQDGVRIADVGCGTGWSSIALARNYPRARVDGIDLDAASIADATEILNGLNGTDVADRVRFAVRDAADPELSGRYQLVCIFDALHDMARPVEVLRACRSMLAPDGVVLLMEPGVGERFTSPAPDPERFQYAVSVLHCLPVGMAEQPSAATGTVMRPSTVRGYAAAAGLSTEVIRVDHPFHRLYRLE
jgi:2-polyprenyl-3-methyl-5-hydroxy-6-metoxy-1,4-benzoquinol methylase